MLADPPAFIAGRTFVTTLLRLLWDLCRLRIGPQDLPFSIALARGLVFVSLAIDLLYATLLSPGAAVLPRLVVSALVLVGVPWLLLASRRRLPRYPQTLAALAGSGVLFKLAMLPLALVILDLPVPSTPEQLVPAQVLVGWLTLALLSWRLVVTGHILRHALDLRLASGLLLALAVFAFELVLGQLVLAGSGAAAT